jgi:hypothetical protein
MGSSYLADSLKWLQICAKILVLQESWLTNDLSIVYNTCYVLLDRTVYGHEKTHHDLYIYSLCLKQTAIQVMVPGFPV